jgi:hypothetical protein
MRSAVTTRSVLLGLYATCLAVYVTVLVKHADPSATTAITQHLPTPLRRLAEIAMEHVGDHKDLFPLDTSDWWGTVLVTLGLLVAASGGIGGGGILVPLFILVFGFRPRYAIPLSNFSILGSSVTNMVMNLPKRHPNADRPLVDWDLILVMEPLKMAGAVSITFVLSVLSAFALFVLYCSDCID